MRHSEIVATSGTVVQLIDPTTGMYMDVTFHPGQTHHALRVMMNGKQFVAHLRLTKIETDDEQDVVATLRVPAAPSDAPPVRKDAAPHPATVLKPQDRTRAGVEGARANPLAAPHPATVPNPNAPHPATVLRREDVTRAGLEAIRVSDAKPQTRAERAAQQTARAAVEAEIEREKHEPVMTDEELGALRTDVDAQRQKNAQLAGGGQMGALEPLVESDVDMHALDEHPMSEEEVEKLHADAAQLRDRSEGSPEAGESKVEFVEEDVVQVEDELAVATQPTEGAAPASEAPAATADAPKAQESGKKGGKGGKGGVTLR